MSRVAEFVCLAVLSLAGTAAAQDFVSVSPDGTGFSSSRAEPRPEVAVVAPVRADPAIPCANRDADPKQCRFRWRSALKRRHAFPVEGFLASFASSMRFRHIRLHSCSEPLKIAG